MSQKRDMGTRECLVAGTIFRISSSMEFVLWMTSLIVRFWGIIIGGVGAVFWGCMWFFLLGF